MREGVREEHSRPIISFMFFLVIIFLIERKKLFTNRVTEKTVKGVFTKTGQGAAWGLKGNEANSTRYAAWVRDHCFHRQEGGDIYGCEVSLQLDGVSCGLSDEAVGADDHSSPTKSGKW